MFRLLLGFSRHWQSATPFTKSTFINASGRYRTLLTSFRRSKAVAAVVQPTDSYQTIGKWLLGLSGMTFGAVVLGGATRLTESGLSMVDWHPFKEAPPFTEEQWLQEFAKYKQFPEYQYQVNQHGEMSLSRFKFIWYMEYTHRMWGRLIGAVFAIPGAYFWYKGYLSRRMKPRVLIYGGLLAFQGLLGWLMVRSGLKEPQPPVGHNPGEPFTGVPRVDHFWLSAHLSSAAILFSLFLWGSFDHLAHHVPVKPFDSLKQMKILAHSSKALTFTTLVFGAFVAGLDAGLVYNSWPKMADRWIPGDLITPQYGSTISNLLRNPTGVQFSHRLLAYSTVATVTALWAIVMRTGLAKTGPQIRTAAHLVLAAAWGQSTLGVMTLLYYVPVWLGVMHQGGSLVLLSSLLWFTHCLRAVPK